MKTAKLGAIFLMSVLALAGTGAGYALWSDTLSIDGTVNTGSIGAVFEEGWAEDTDDFEYTDPLEKDYSWIECIVSLDGQTLTVTVYNAYPCIDYYNYFYVHNTGTIPIHVGNFEILTDTLPADATLEVCWDDPPAGQDYIQIHPCETELGYVHIHLCNDAAQGATYTFTATLMYWQWNETPT